ncbi:MAG TPA: hypothetical protein VND91_02610 [Candidatus Saccharimonadia bacterium]|nr:hypothetical protein [Candidatus Saccharimonadia bacterium]
MNLLAELKRRNVIRMAGLYLVGAWLIVQVAETILPVFAVPTWILRALIILLALGFVPALMLAWVFELTPQGLIRDDEVLPRRSMTARTARRIDRIVVLGLLIVIGLMATERFWIAGKGARSNAGDDAVPIAVSATPSASSAPFSTPAPRGSVAVLSFTNMSPEPDNEYFADGIAEELLNVLARIEGLKVASRTSAFSFKGKQIDVREIARQLNVAHVLEGSVRKQGGKVRITAQLIDAATDKHLWSATYNRELTDIFAVQEEIAQAISAALSEALGADGGLAKIEVVAPTEDLQAYELYLRGRQLFYMRGESLRIARKLLEESVARDPGFAEAWAILAGVHLVSPDYTEVPRSQGFAAARDAADRARGLDAGLALPYAVLADIAGERGDQLEKERLLDQAIARDPSDSSALLWRGVLHLIVGNLDKSEDDLRRAFEIDPLAGVTVGWLATVQGLRGDRKAAQSGLQRALDLGWSYARYLDAQFALVDRDRARAISDLRTYYRQYEDAAPTARAVIDALYAAIEDPGKSDALLAAVRADRTGIHDRGWSPILVVLGLHGEAIDIELDKNLPRGRYYRSIWFPTARGTLSEPRFLELAERDGLLAYWNANGFPEGCRLVDAPPRYLDCKERWRRVAAREQSVAPSGVMTPRSAEHRRTFWKPAAPVALP